MVHLFYFIFHNELQNHKNNKIIFAKAYIISLNHKHFNDFANIHKSLKKINLLHDFCIHFACILNLIPCYFAAFTLIMFQCDQTRFASFIAL